ncbi:DHA2 family efflux MFS transporter permease subunit [Novosphingobium lentum]|uniref:DHA2 family efflux MFS transporter permease subunit n=1 Tax=Novosphingobium lentum TaxID=145287 RepID=UPI0008340F3E|nr:DHA2 family efflux MFS transporter permease subunit [Novosphingobium lentum]
MSAASKADPGRLDTGPGGLDERPALVVPNRSLLLAAVMAAMIMTMIDTTIANVALPHMQAALSATQETVTWVLTSYVLASAVALPASGWLVDRLGMRMVLVGSVMMFTIASVMCGLAQNMTQIVLFRVLQGLAGAFISPITQTIMLDTSTPRERPKVMSIFTQGVMVGPIAGPVLGGYLTENFDWRWVFFVNVPIGIVCTFALLALMPHTPKRHRKFDMTGWLLVAVAVSCLQLMLDRGASKDWFGSPEIVIYAVLSACAAWMAVVHLATARAPLFATALFKDRNLVAALGLYMLVGMVMMSVLALLPVLLQSVFGYPAIEAGWLLTPRGVGMVGAIMLTGRHLDKADPRLLLAFGLGIAGISLWMMTGWTPDMPTGPIIFAGVLQGVGLSFTFIPLNLISFATIDAKFRTDAAGLNMLFRNVGSSTGIAAGTVLLSRNLQLNHAELGAQITRMSVPFDLDRITAYGGIGDSAMTMVDLMVNKQAAMIAYLDDFLVMSIACFAAIPVLLIVKGTKKGAKADPDAVAAAGH